MELIYAADPVRRAGMGDLGVLPDAVISVLTFYLDTRSICRLACCSTLLRVFAYESPLWMNQALRGHDGPVSYQANWRQTALSLLHAAAQMAAVQAAAVDSMPGLDKASHKAALLSSQSVHKTNADVDSCATHHHCFHAAALQMQQQAQHLAVAVAAAVKPVPQVPGFASDFLYRRWYRSNVALSTFLPAVDEVPRVQRSTLSPAEFLNRYDTPAQPVILTGFMDAEWPKGWPDHWQLGSLATRYGPALFSASRPSGGKTRVRFREYIDYMARQTDEDPLYIFDEGFVEAAPDMLAWYQAPSIIKQDFSQLLDPSVRPPYRWLVLGPARAGASWHVDPALTSAWNALTSGLKRWALYPPHVKPPGPLQLQQHSRCAATAAAATGIAGKVHSCGDSSSSSSSSSWHTVSTEAGKDVSSHHSSSSKWSSSSSSDGVDDDSAGGGCTSLQWYLEVYPYLPPHLRPYEFVQHPGEIVFIPGGWWHCVLNLEPSVAVTQNFVSQANLERVIAQSAVGSGAYHADPLRFYKPMQRPWLAAWQQRQRQQWEQQYQQQQQHCAVNTLLQKQQQQLDTADSIVAAVAESVTETDSATGDTVAESAAAAAAAAPGQVGVGLSAGATRPPISWTVQCSPLASRSSSNSCTYGSDASTAAAAAAVHCGKRPPSILVADIFCHGGTAAAAAADEEAEGQEAAWSGLLTSVLGGRGYLRSRLIGPLLNKLWQQQQQQQGGCLQQPQQQQPQQLLPLAGIATEWLAQREWQQLLGCICEIHGVCGAQECELDHELLFPGGGSDSLVFTVKDVVVKFLVGQRGLPAALAVATEAAMLLQLQQQQQQQDLVQFTESCPSSAGREAAQPTLPACSFPQLIGHGMVHLCDWTCEPMSPSEITAAAAVKCSTATGGSAGAKPNSSSSSYQLPYVVLSRVQGQGTASELKHKLSPKQKEQLAWSCGQLLAAVHKLPLQLTHHGSSSSSSTSRNAVTPGSGSSSSSRRLPSRSKAAESNGSSIANRTMPQSSNNAEANSSSSSNACVVMCSSMAEPGSVVRLLLEGTVWRGRGGDIWSSLLGRACTEQQQQQQQQQHLVDGAANLSQLGTAAAAAAAAAAASVSDKGRPAKPCQTLTTVDTLDPTGTAAAAAVWWPFVQFLQQRRKDMLQQLEFEASQLLDLGVVASEVFARFPAAADTLAAAAQQEQQQQQQALQPGTCSPDFLQNDANVHSHGSVKCNTATAAEFPCIGVGADLLPAWLLQQLSEYIPGDLSTVAAAPTAATAAARCGSSSSDHGDSSSVCGSGSGSGSDASSCRLPCVLHGDLMAGNLLLQLQTEQQQQQQQQQDPLGLQHVSLIDFADGGMGDALYDFVAVFVSVLECDVQLLQTALKSYSCSIDVAAVWPARLVTHSAAAAAGSTHSCSSRPMNVHSTRKPSQSAAGCRNTSQQPQQIISLGAVCSTQSCSLSKAFMCYLLLHEEGVVGQLLEAHPQLRNAGSLEEGIQQQLFGWMDAWWTQMTAETFCL